MAGRAVVVPVCHRVGLIKCISGQTSVSLYGPVAAAVAVRCHTRTLSRGATWRHTVGRPAASTVICHRRRSATVTGSSETAYFGGWTKILYFMTRV